MRLETARGVVIARTNGQSTMCHGQSQIGYLANYINLNDGRPLRPAVTQPSSWLHAEFEEFRVVIQEGLRAAPAGQAIITCSWEWVRRRTPGLGAAEYRIYSDVFPGLLAGARSSR